jgi:hypothetical protein
MVTGWRHDGRIVWREWGHRDDLQRLGLPQQSLNGRFRARGLWHGLRLRETAARWEDCCLECAYDRLGRTHVHNTRAQSTTHAHNTPGLAHASNITRTAQRAAHARTAHAHNTRAHSTRAYRAHVRTTHAHRSILQAWQNTRAQLTRAEHNTHHSARVIRKLSPAT